MTDANATFNVMTQEANFNVGATPEQVTQMVGAAVNHERQRLAEHVRTLEVGATAVMKSTVEAAVANTRLEGQVATAQLQKQYEEATHRQQQQVIMTEQQHRQEAEQKEQQFRQVVAQQGQAINEANRAKDDTVAQATNVVTNLQQQLQEERRKAAEAEEQ